MIILLLVCVPRFVIAEASFEEKLKEANHLLRDEPNANDTMEFLKKLHGLEKEINDELISSTKPSAHMLEEMKNYASIKEAHLNPLDDTIEEVNRKRKVDTALFQGDIILTKEQANEILEDMNNTKGNRNKRQAYRDESYPVYLWSDGVTYSFHNTTPWARKVFKTAAAMWSWHTCVNFGEVHMSEKVKNKIAVVNGEGCWSHVGRINGTQALSLGHGCESVGKALHEIGHALGLFHTQSRHDRDSFVTIQLKNIIPGKETEFVRESEKTNYNYNLTYDYGSIMHSAASSLSKNNEPTIVPHDIKFMQTLGSPFISFYDRLMVNLHYKCLDRCNGRPTAKCENGGYPHPRNCWRCICPSGYGGNNCDRRPPGCGKILQATESYQDLSDNVGYSNYYRNADVANFKMCHHWIEAPAGSKIEVIFQSYTDNLSSDGCVKAGVEIKTLADKRLTGYRFCSPNHSGTSLVSVHNIVPIIIYSSVQKATSLLRYRIASSGPATSEQTPQPTSQLTTQSSSTHTPRSISPPEKGCKDRFLCTMLEEMGFCSSAEYKQEFKDKVCPGLCA